MQTSKGLVFDIKRFALHDGSGIRTTLFFKGCPLRCKWCHNPEGLDTKRRLIFFKSKCIGCKQCVKVSNDSLIFESRPMLHEYNGNQDVIEEACPSTAIQYDSHYYDEDTLFDKVMADAPFFKYGGGVTFSGGEPLMQHELLKRLLKRFNEAHIHTTIETSLYCKRDVLESILPYCDTIYCDLKVYDDTLHQAYTSVSNKIILDNIAYLLTNDTYKDRVIVRTPLIPNMTATKINIQSISEYLYHLYDGVHYELLNYNPLASSKYDLYEHLEYAVTDADAFSRSEMQEFYNILENVGIKHIIKE